jgi:hypothetical protein
MKIKSLAAILTLITLLSTLWISWACVHANACRYMVNNDIDLSLRQEIQTLNDKVLTTIKNNDFNGLIGYFVNGVTDEQKQQIQEVFPSTVKEVNEESFEPYQDFYEKCMASLKYNPGEFRPGINSDSTVYVGNIGDVATDEMFLSFEISNDFTKRLLSMLYVKQDGEWKLHNCNFGTYVVAGKDSVEWYNEASAEYAKGYLIPALFRAQLADECLHASPFIKYDQQGKIADFFQKLTNEDKSKYTFPIELSSISSNPAVYGIELQFVQNETTAIVYGIEPQFVQKEIIPVVTYVTSYPLGNTSALTEEAKAMSPLLLNMFPGIADGASNIVFEVSLQPPDPRHRVFYDTRYITVDLSK